MVHPTLGRLASLMGQTVRLRPRPRSQPGTADEPEGQVTQHDRDAVLAAVIAEADRRLDGSLPWDPAVAERCFGTQDRLVSILQVRWHTHLAWLVEEALDAEPMDLAKAVIDAWRTCALDLPGVRRILDVHADSPGMQVAHRKDWELLASAKGLAAADDPRVDATGRRIEELARSGAQLGPATATTDEHQTPGAS